MDWTLKRHYQDYLDAFAPSAYSDEDGKRLPNEQQRFVLQDAIYDLLGHHLVPLALEAEGRYEPLSISAQETETGELVASLIRLYEDLNVRKLKGQDRNNARTWAHQLVFELTSFAQKRPAVAAGKRVTAYGLHEWLTTRI